MANVKDVREQYRLSPLTNTHEQCAYGALDCNVYEGTIDVARRLGFKHPTLFSKGEHEPWRMTTDFLCLVSDNNKSHLLAISVKPSLRELDERDKQLLKIEREYWRIRNVEWQLLTESCFSKSVRLGLSFLQAWALHEYRVPQEQQRRVAETLRSFQCISFAHAVNVVANGNTEQAQRAIMQAVWSGHLYIDFEALAGPEPLIKIISKREFDRQNPILCRRFACL